MKAYGLKPVFSLFLLCGLLLLASCQDKTQEKPVGEVAVSSYEHLMREDYDAYLRNMVDYEHMPESYRNEMKALLAQYVRKEQERRGGFVRVKLVSDTVFGDQANAFLELEYKDGTREEIAVPLIRHQQGWRLH